MAKKNFETSKYKSSASHFLKEPEQQVRAEETKKVTPTPIPTPEVRDEIEEKTPKYVEKMVRVPLNEQVKYKVDPALVSDPSVVEVKTARLTVLVSPTIFQRANERAKMEHLTLGKWVRKILEQELSK